jgi:hypothetical protein
MKSIVLPAGTEHVQFGELAYRIADALWPSNGEDDERIDYALACIRFEKELLNAAKSGTLPVKDAMTFGPHPYPVGYALKTAMVTVDDLQRFVSDRGLSVIVETTEPQTLPVLTAGALGGVEWVEKAQICAREIIKRQRDKDLYPDQIAIADEIANEFRPAGIVGADGKPLSGATIKRHALKGISSATGKQLSTTIRRGK